MQTDRPKTSNISGTVSKLSYSMTHLNVPEGGHVALTKSKSKYIIGINYRYGYN